MATDNCHDVLQQQLNALGISDYQPAYDLKDDLGLDSLSLIQLVMGLSQSLQIEIASHEIIPAHFGTIAQLEAFLKQKTEDH